MRTSKPDELNAILQQLIPMGLHPNLDDLIHNMLPDSTPNERLQLKMQLRELHTPCLQPIDLRNRVDGRCYEHHILGLTHWLDDIALNLFKQQLELYQQRYTRGVYDAVMQAHNNFKVLHQKKQQRNSEPEPETTEVANPTSKTLETKKLPVKVARFGYQFMRNEIRLLYHSQVLITLLETQYLVHGITLDISLAGLCLRVPHAVAFKLGQELNVQFGSLGDKLGLPELRNGVNYLIVGIERQPQRQLLRLHISQPEPIMQRLMGALARSGSKQVRLNVDDLLEQLRIRGFEQSYLNATTTLPLLISQQGTLYALHSQNNRELYQYWHDEEYQPVLGRFFTPERLSKICPPGVSTVKSLLYSFIHRQGGRAFFYCALNSELTDRAQRKLFWHTGARRPSFRVQRLIIRQLTADDFSPHAEQQTLIAEHQLGDLRYLVLLQDLSSEEIRSEYQRTPKPSLPLEQLNEYCLPRHSVPTFEVNMSQEPRRQAPRYRHQTEVEVTTPAQQKVIGYTVDFSETGLRIVLGQPVDVRRNQPLLLAFPKWQSLDKQIPLRNLPYRVLYINAEQNQLVLTASGQPDEHTGVQFIRRLINANRGVLQEDTERQPLPGIIDIFRQLTVPHLASIPIFVVKENNLFRPTALGITPATYHLNHRLGQDSTDDLLDPLLGEYWSQLVCRPLNEPSRHALTTDVKIYLSLRQERWQHKLHAKKLESEFASKQEQTEFIRHAMRHGEFIALKFQLTRYQRNILHPNLMRDFHQLIRANLSQARTLEQELLALSAMIELTDCTEEVLLRQEMHGSLSDSH